VTVGSCGIPPFEVGINGSVGSRYQHLAWFPFPRSRSNDCFEIVRQVGYLRSRHESGLLSRQVGCEVLMKLSGIEVGETVCGLLYCTRLAEVVAWEALALVRLVLSSVWHVGRDVHQTSDGQARTGFGDYGFPIAMTDKNAWSSLLSKDALGGSHIVFKTKHLELPDKFQGKLDLTRSCLRGGDESGT
jgi:hypothetical protein